MATSNPKNEGGLPLRQGSPNKRAQDDLSQTTSWLGESYTGSSISMPSVFIKPSSPGQSGTGWLDSDNSRRRAQNPTPPVVNWDTNAQVLGGLVMGAQSIEPCRGSPLWPHIELMFDRCEYHRTHYTGFFPPPWWMVGKSLLEGPEFTNKWAKELKNARFRWMNVEFVSEPDDMPNYTIDSYNGTYHPSFFIFWREEVEDYKHMFMGKPVDISEEALEDIEAIVADLSKKLISDKEIMSDPPVDYIWRPVATGGFTGDETKPEWEIEYDSPVGDLEEEILIAARSQAPKRPGETRDIGILKPSSLRFHRRFMWLLQKACNRIPGCPYGQDQDYIRKVVRKFGEEKEYFYMRDYTKSGMTIPHEVQAAVFRGFYRRRPELGEKAARFYRDQQLYFKDPGGAWDMFRPDTGSPLGLFVEGYTLLQYAIHELNCRSISFPPKSLKFSATNDDMVVGGDSPLDLEEYLNVDQMNNASLGMWYKDTKTGISRNRFVYCEEYWIDEELASKESLFTVAIVGAWHAMSPFIAKEYVYSILLTCGEITPGIEAALRDAQAMVGWEFHEDEHRWPFLFGGWLPCIKEGLDHSIEWYDGDLRATAGYWANRCRLRPKGTLGNKPHLAIGRKIGLELVAEPKDIPDWLDLVPLLGTKRTLERHYRKAQSNPKDVFQEYMTLSKLRQEVFTKIMTGKKEYPYIPDKWLERHPNSVWLPNFPGMRTERPITRVILPRYGFKDCSFSMKLQLLKSKGYIEVNEHKLAHKSQIFLAERGITDTCKYSYLPVGDEGISQAILSSYYPGYLPWYEKYGKSVVSLWDGDGPLDCTRLWAYSPGVSLMTLVRSWSYIVPKIKRAIDSIALQYMADKYLSVLSAPPPEYSDSSEDEDQPITNEEKTLLEMYIRDVIRDWCEDPDLFVAEMRHRLIPLPAKERPPEYLLTQQLMEFNDPFTIEAAKLPNEHEGDPTSEADSDEGHFDPWAELGY